MRHPKVSLKCAQALADNAIQITELRKAVGATAPGTEQAVIYMDAIDALLTEKERLIDLGFRGLNP